MTDRELPHRAPCPACGARLLFHHCNPCHRLFLHCAGCEIAMPEVREPDPAGALAPQERPRCPRCTTPNVRPATRSDLQNRDLLDLLPSE